MTSPNDQFTDIANRGQEAVTTAVRTWTENVQSFAGKVGGAPSQLPDLSSVVDQYFDFAGKVLTNQREVAQQWASATTKASEAVTEQARRATESITRHSADGTDAVVNNAAEAVRAAGEKAASTVRTVGNTTNN